MTHVPGIGYFCSCGGPVDTITLTFELPSGFIVEEQTRICPTCDCIDVYEVLERKGQVAER